MFTNDLFKTGEIKNDVNNFFPTKLEDGVIIDLTLQFYQLIYAQVQ